MLRCTVSALNLTRSCSKTGTSARSSCRDRYRDFSGCRSGRRNGCEKRGALQMRNYLIVTLLSGSALAGAQPANTGSSLKTVLLQELRETHNEKNWFVSQKEAVAGLTPEQAAWSDGKNHSVGQLVPHLNYWHAANLTQLKHQPARKVGNNDETFNF